MHVCSDCLAYRYRSDHGNLHGIFVVNRSGIGVGSSVHISNSLQLILFLHFSLLVSHSLLRCSFVWAKQHTLHPFLFKLGAIFLTQHLAGYGAKLFFIYNFE
jgi:hypothetical protein